MGAGLETSEGCLNDIGHEMLYTRLKNMWGKGKVGSGAGEAWQPQAWGANTIN